MPTDSIIGAGILGHLKYTEHRHSWAIELGQWLGTFIIVFEREDAADESVRRQTTTAIDKILVAHHIHLTTSGILESAVSAASQLLDKIQASEGDFTCALVLIGQCTFALRTLVDQERAERVLQSHLRDIDHRCSSLDIATESLGQILLQQNKENLRATGVSRLMVQLSKPLDILIMSSDPRDADRLRTGEERRELKHAIERTRLRGAVSLHDVPSCRVRDITQTLDRYNPNILHFSGHGSTSGLYLENDKGEAIAVNKAALGALLGTQRDLKLVFLNACYSRDQAQSIADAVGYVIGMEGSILDEDSIAFSREFYAALGHGRTFEAAFNRANLAMGLTTNFSAHLLKRSV